MFYILTGNNASKLLGTSPAAGAVRRVPAIAWSGLHVLRANRRSTARVARYGLALSNFLLMLTKSNVLMPWRINIFFECCLRVFLRPYGMLFVGSCSTRPLHDYSTCSRTEYSTDFVLQIISYFIAVRRFLATSIHLSESVGIGRVAAIQLKWSLVRVSC